jgi:hypothetical protein
MQIINNHQNNNAKKAKKIVIIDDSSKESKIKKIVKTVLFFGGSVATGYLAKMTVDFFKKSSDNVVSNIEAVKFLRRQFDTKPENWEFSPRYYFIKFLDKLMKYDISKITDDELTLTLKYLVLSVVPTNNDNDIKFFGSILGEVLNILQQGMKNESGFKNWLAEKSLNLASKDNAALARWLLVDGLIDKDFLKNESGIRNQEKRFNYLVNNFIIGNESVKGGIKKYFNDLSCNLKKMDFSSYKNIDNPKKEPGLEKNNCHLNENDLKPIKKLYDSPEISQKIKDGIINQKDADGNFGGYQLGLLLINLFFKTTIFQIFGTRQEKNT